MMEDIIFELTNAIVFDASVRQYRYRRALEARCLFQIERERQFEEFLAEKAGGKIDNHTLYQITYPDGTSFSIRCSDAYMYIGLGVNECCW